MSLLLTGIITELRLVPVGISAGLKRLDEAAPDMLSGGHYENTPIPGYLNQNGSSELGFADDGVNVLSWEETTWAWGDSGAGFTTTRFADDGSGLKPSGTDIVFNEETLLGYVPAALPAGTHDVEVVLDRESELLLKSFTITGGGGCNSPQGPTWASAALLSLVVDGRRSC